MCQVGFHKFWLFFNVAAAVEANAPRHVRVSADGEVHEDQGPKWLLHPRQVTSKRRQAKKENMEDSSVDGWVSPESDWMPKWKSALLPESEGKGWGKEPQDEIEERRTARRLVRSADTSVMATMVRLGEGVGPLTYSRSPTAHQNLNRELRQRLVAQDVATLFFLFFILGVATWVSCLGVLQFADDPSQVTFYTDPRHTQQRLTCSSTDVDSFLEAFNTQPHQATLRLIGRRVPRTGTSWSWLLPGASSQLRYLIPWRRRPEGVAFHVSLDLSTFISGDGDLAPQEVSKLENHIVSKNPLEILVLRKRVQWENWEDMATNIKQRLRGKGFQGAVEVRFDAQEDVRIYRNNRWQNFIRAPVTHMLSVLSGCGLLLWLPYLYCRSDVVVVESHFHIQLDVNRYWEMLSAGLDAEDGFRA